ncbi:MULTISPECIES: LytS/YhcK type 5TM receptor domain-containing protein [Clostridium]|uniref:LytS/YhcK type 5TM receptor domain-containing protein n=1 Tax=Clostridium TaxID=1485 RepID=UPI0008247968|nr:MULTISPECIES: LytS/YhcK type 5TM receptor domain-containing protein [Clostridium]PJI06697.1 sensor histidine kinase [Clostridium sp. CT7]
MIYAHLIENMAVIALAAYIYSQCSIFGNFINKNQSIKDKLTMVIFFSMLAILGTYMGVKVEYNAIANTRSIGAITAGYVGGPLVGVIVGIIAGVHRYTIGGFTALACCIATVISGFLGGIVKKIFKNEEFNIRDAFVSSILAEVIQVIIILCIAKPRIAALELEKVIALPMIMINSIGTAIFIYILKNSKYDYNRLSAVQAQRALNIAKSTIKYITKRGLTNDTALKICKAICKTDNVKGVALSYKNDVFSYFGESFDWGYLRKMIDDFYDNPKVAQYDLEDIGKTYLFIICPISVEDSIDGAIGMIFSPSYKLNKYFLEFCNELSGLLSVQIELFKLNQKAHLADLSELKVLRAQVQPHFLFNTLNTISSFCRTNPVKARQLIISLSNYFRQTLSKDEFVELEEEIDMLKSYLYIEKARFGERINVIFDVSNDVLHDKVPSFIVQPIVENSIKHGILKKAAGGNIYINIYKKDNELEFLIRDNGIGMDKRRYEEVIKNLTGTGLNNVNERLKLIYNRDTGLNIKSSKNKGTLVSFKIPIWRVKTYE